MTLGPGAWPVDPAWWDHAHTLSPGDGGDAAAWPLLLTPSRIDPSWTPPPASVLTYHELTWHAPPPRTETPRLETRAVWTSVRDARVETARQSVALVRGEVAAKSLHVMRFPGTAEPFGTRPSLTRPAEVPHAKVITTRLSIGQPQVLLFAELSGSRPAIHVDPEYARRHGYAGPLVQGSLFVLRQVAEHAATHSSGRVRAWFRTPLVAGDELAQDVRRHGPSVQTVYRSAAAPSSAGILVETTTPADQLSDLS